MVGKPTTVATALGLAAVALAGSMFQCPVGSPQCCHSWRDVNTFEPSMMPPPGIPGLDHGMPDGLVGFACKAGQNDMTCGDSHTPPLCCEMNDFGGVLTFGCTQAKPGNYPPQHTY